MPFWLLSIVPRPRGSLLSRRQETHPGARQPRRRTPTKVSPNTSLPSDDVAVRPMGSPAVPSRRGHGGGLRDSDRGSEVLTRLFRLVEFSLTTRDAQAVPAHSQPGTHLPPSRHRCSGRREQASRVASPILFCDGERVNPLPVHPTISPEGLDPCPGLEIMGFLAKTT